MALVKVGEKALGARLVLEDGQLTEARIRKKPTKKVLNEEEFLEDLGRIIQRDFFPDLSKLKTQKEYMEAVERNDLVRMRELAMKYAATGQSRSESDTPMPYHETTPSTFETPDINTRRPTPAFSDILDKQRRAQPAGLVNQEDADKQKKGDSKLSLDKYLAQHTSEDNASFDDIMAASEEKHRQKHAWLYEAEQRHQEEQTDMLAMEGPKSMKPIEGSSVTTWGYKAKNALMYVPEGLELTSAEQIFKKPKTQQVIHKNTHIHTNPFKVSPSNASNMAKSAAIRASMKTGRIGHDGKELMPSNTPKVKGYGFVAEPSPMPGSFGESPLMTWGEICGTPSRLDGSDTPGSGIPGPAFTMAKVPKKERLVLSLVEEVSKKHRAKKQKALQRVTESFISPSPKRMRTLGTAERLLTLTPAARKLVSKRLTGIKTDKALRASYTPSPARTPAGDKTPILRRTPRGTPSRTPSSTPSGTPSGTPRVAEESLTDNLLDLPKRKTRQRASAMDFF